MELYFTGRPASGEPENWLPGDFYVVGLSTVLEKRCWYAQRGRKDDKRRAHELSRTRE